MFLYVTFLACFQAVPISCDEEVIKKLDEKGKREYGNTLLNMANTVYKTYLCVWSVWVHGVLYFVNLYPGYRKKI